MNSLSSIVWTTLGVFAMLGGARAHQDLTPVGLVKELRAATHRSGLPVEAKEVDYHRLIAALPAALELARKSATLWQKIPSEDFPNAQGIRLFDVVQRSLRMAALSAPTREEKEKWLRLEQELVIRMLRDPHSRRIYAEKRNPEDDGSDYNALLRIQGLGLGSVRQLLGRSGFLRTGDWAFCQGISWIDQPAAVVERAGAAFVEATALASVGIPVEVNNAAVAVGGPNRRMRIPVAAQGRVQAKQAFRIEGRVYLPIEELHRQGIYTVQVDRLGQMAQLWLEPPSDGDH